MSAAVALLKFALGLINLMLSDLFHILVTEAVMRDFQTPGFGRGSTSMQNLLTSTYISNT